MMIISKATFKVVFEMIFNHCSLTKWEVNKAEHSCCDDDYVRREERKIMLAKTNI